ncbi:hypothetical protein K1X12_08710 [Hyphomonas sp. WL0036]|uniref:hypothetical protein n=1 Tax=Hyphomonas sediminis TaxID=2866160 RepID=UPI001C7E29DB|nr:hypothetical protein [Hyphomonas sediminis]MBY9066978.1 hypothetical protein [Hyphomonas sediminis]
MTNIHRLEERPKLVDLAAFGRAGYFQDKSIFANGKELLRSARFIEYDQDNFQLDVCDCGIVGCIPGGLVSLRRHNDCAIIVPAAHAILDGDEEATPPAFIYELGPIAFSPSVYATLRDMVPAFPEHSSLRYLSHSEVIVCNQLTAPGHFLGNIGMAPTIKTDLVLAVSDGELSKEIASLEIALGDRSQRQLPEHSRTPDRIVEFHLDLPGYPVWRGLGYRKEKPQLLIG